MIVFSIVNPTSCRESTGPPGRDPLYSVKADLKPAVATCLSPPFETELFFASVSQPDFLSARYELNFSPARGEMG